MYFMNFIVGNLVLMALGTIMKLHDKSIIGKIGELMMVLSILIIILGSLYYMYINLDIIFLRGK